MPTSPEKTEQRKQEIIGSVAQHLVRDGFRNSGIRALAKSAGISDRMLMHYFDTKEALIAEALAMLARGFSANLDLALPDRTASGSKIVESMVALSLRKEIRPALELWLEIVGLAVRGDEPYKTTAGLFLDEWEQWISRKLRPEQRHRAPELLAQIEGEVMVQLLRH